ncbi:MAG: aldehyde dehydrogenase family protein [Solirubrobacteraceae bacterium]
METTCGPALVLDHDLRIVSEKQFGPALPVIPCDDDEDVAQANDTWSRLCSSVSSGDDEHVTPWPSASAPA